MPQRILEEERAEFIQEVLRWVGTLQKLIAESKMVDHRHTYLQYSRALLKVLAPLFGEDSLLSLEYRLPRVRVRAHELYLKLMVIPAEYDPDQFSITELVDIFQQEGWWEPGEPSRLARMLANAGHSPITVYLSSDDHLKLEIDDIGPKRLARIQAWRDMWRTRLSAQDPVATEQTGALEHL